MRLLVFKKTIFYKFKEYFFPIFLAIMLGFFLRVFIIEVYKVPSESMLPTLLPGDHIAVSKLAYGFRIPFMNYTIKWSSPKHGDLVIIKKKDDPYYYVKRVVAVPGDNVEIIKDKLFINGQEIIKSYGQDVKKYGYIGVDDIVYNEKILESKKFNVVYNKEHNLSSKNLIHKNSIKGYFVMGDNRTNSIDSRSWGEVSEDCILGNVIYIWFSIDAHSHFIRWSRIGKP